MKNRILWSLAVLFILLSPLILKLFNGASVINVDANPVERRIIRESVLASGNLVFRDEVILSPEIIARVRSVLVREGERVQKGKILIYLDDQNLQQMISLQKAQVAIDRENVERQKINVKTLEILFERQSSLLNKGFVSKARYDEAFYAHEAAKAELKAGILTVRRAEAAMKQAEQRLQQTVIKAPISGTVVSIGIKAGETAVPSATGIPGSSLLTIAKRDSILVDLNIDENDISRLSLDNEALISCPTFPDDGLKGKISEIALSPRSATRGFATNDAVGRSYSVKVNVLGKEISKLRQGMSCRARVFTSNPDPVLSIAVQAVLSDQSWGDDGVSLPMNQRNRAEKYVFVVSNGFAKKRSIVTGNADDEYQEVIQGLSENDMVIIGPYRILSSLANNSRVSPQALEEKGNAASY